MLRGMYSFPKVVSMYEAIKNGTYRDKEDVSPAVAAANARAARDKYYADKRAKAEGVADSYRELANRDARFVEIERRLAWMNLGLARAEVGGAVEELQTLKAEQAELISARRKVLDDLGIYEENLLPRYECKKCSDSGFLADGRACDCYKG